MENVDVDLSDELFNELIQLVHAGKDGATPQEVLRKGLFLVIERRERLESIGKFPLVSHCTQRTAPVGVIT